MRAFIGIPISEELKTRIISIQSKFLGFDFKPVERENLHFNLKFFEEITAEQAESLRKALEASKQAPFEIDISGLGAFPNAEYVRVLWLGVKEGREDIVKMAKLVWEAAKPLGFGPDERFEPHLTLGRVRSSRNKEGLLSVMKDNQDAEIGKMKVDRLVMFESKLGPNGPVYEEVFEISLS